MRGNQKSQSSKRNGGNGEGTCFAGTCSVIKSPCCLLHSLWRYPDLATSRASWKSHTRRAQCLETKDQIRFENKYLKSHRTNLPKAPRGSPKEHKRSRKASCKNNGPPSRDKGVKIESPTRSGHQIGPNFEPKLTRHGPKLTSQRHQHEPKGKQQQQSCYSPSGNSRSRSNKSSSSNGSSNMLLLLRGVRNSYY